MKCSLLAGVGVVSERWGRVERMSLVVERNAMVSSPCATEGKNRGFLAGSWLARSSLLTYLTWWRGNCDDS
jgi:hypothetical protein